MASPLAVARLVTAVELAEMPAGRGRLELVDGVVRSVAPAGGLHGMFSNTLGYEVTSFVRQHALGVVFTAKTGFRIAKDPDTVRAPDLAFVASERAEAALVPGFPDLAPDMVAEVVSPSDRAVDVVEKALAWIAAGVRLVWVVDHANAQGTVYTQATITTLRGDAVLDGGHVLPGFALRLHDLWR